jgi:hypothetical protein
VSTTKTSSEAKPVYRHWRSLSDGFLVSLVVVGPTFLVEELWRGKPLIDQGGIWWVIPGAIMAVGFFVGGVIAGRHRQHRKGAFNQGVLVAALTLSLLLVADVIRRLVLVNGLNLGVLKLWLASIAAALLVGGLGGLTGRRRTLMARKRNAMNRFI